jgi:hypothetical protein
MNNQKEEINAETKESILMILAKRRDKIESIVKEIWPR